VVARLGELGLAFSLDDFGTGYSSLAHLKRLPVQELKIDRSFVMHMDSDPNDAAIVRSTVDLARSLGLRVVAEGVESQSTWDQLARFGCHLAQGYHLSRPLPVARLDAWLDEREAALGSAVRRGVGA
jgi:EAL domain-containing protein (putative c-di-GMP-specific phosphodiesterase class I)